jgi:hypothetical protein
LLGAWTTGRGRSLQVAISARRRLKPLGALPLLLHGGFTLNMNNVLYVPLLRRNLISVASLEDDGYECLFRNNKYHIKFNEVIIDLAPR